MQKDLFGSSLAATVIPSLSESKPDFLQRYRLNLRLDQVVIAALLFVVAYVLVFSFGVESGKRYAMAEIKAERSMRERMARELGEKIFSSSNQPVQTETNSVKAKDLHSKALQAEGPVKEAALAAVTEKTVPADDAKQKSSSQAASKTKGKFAIQTVTFTSKAAAEKYIKLLAGKGYQGLIIPKGKFQQVCVAGFESKEKALQSMPKLKSQGLAPKDAYVRPVA